jgi:hypothetical protein
MRRMKRGVVVTALLIGSPRADAADCANDEAELRAMLTSEASKTRTWNTVWGWIYTGTSVTAATLAAIDPEPIHELQVGLYVSAGKAGIAAGSRWVLPLSVRVPAPTGDACADLALLRRELARIGKKERSTFWMNHIGGIVLNVVGGYIVYNYTETDTGTGGATGPAALSVGAGMAVGLVSTYTMPRNAWHTWRDATVVVTPTDGGGVASLVGVF